MLKNLLTQYLESQKKGQKHNDDIRRMRHRYEEKKKQERELLKDLRRKENSQYRFLQRRLSTLIETMIPIDDDVLVCGLCVHIQQELQNESFIKKIRADGEKFIHAQEINESSLSNVCNEEIYENTILEEDIHGNTCK